MSKNAELKKKMNRLNSDLKYILNNLNNTYKLEALKNDLIDCNKKFNTIIKIYMKNSCYNNIIIKDYFNKLECDLMFATNILKPCNFLINDFII